MRRVNVLSIAATVALGVVAGFAGPACAQGVTAYEGARLIVGDGRVIDNATIIVNGDKIAQAGAGVQVPAGANRVNLAGIYLQVQSLEDLVLALHVPVVVRADAISVRRSPADAEQVA